MLDPTCPTCQAILRAQKDGIPLNEQFNWFRGTAIYDIDKAREFVKDGRQIHEFPTADVAQFQSFTGIEGQFRAMTTNVDDHHLDHVPDSQDDPIIIAKFLKPRDKSEKRDNIPIDGHHRIGRAVKYNQPIVYGYALTDEETDQILQDNRAPEVNMKRKMPTKRRRH